MNRKSDSIVGLVGVLGLAVLIVVQLLEKLA